MTMPLDPQKAIEYRKKLSQKLKGKPKSKEHCKKMSEAKLRNPVRYWLGKTRIVYSKSGQKEWMRKNKRAYNLQSWKDANNKRRTLELEKIAGRVKPNNCEICNKVKRICFDHDHKTGKFRGWLCEQCNVILGYANDNPKTLKALAQYLEKFYKSISSTVRD